MASLTKTVLHQRPYRDRFHYWQISVVAAGLDGLCLSFHSLTISSWVVCRQCKLWATTHKLVGESLFWRLLVLQVVSNWSLGPCPIWTLIWWTYGYSPSMCTSTDFQFNIFWIAQTSIPNIDNYNTLLWELKGNTFIENLNSTFSAWYFPGHFLGFSRFCWGGLGFPVHSSMSNNHFSDLPAWLEASFCQFFSSFKSFFYHCQSVVRLHMKLTSPSVNRIWPHEA